MKAFPNDCHHCVLILFTPLHKNQIYSKEVSIDVRPWKTSFWAKFMCKDVEPLQEWIPATHVYQELGIKTYAVILQ